MIHNYNKLYNKNHTFYFNTLYFYFIFYSILPYNDFIIILLHSNSFYNLLFFYYSYYILSTFYYFICFFTLFSILRQSYIICLFYNYNISTLNISSSVYILFLLPIPVDCNSVLSFFLYELLLYVIIVK